MTKLYWILCVAITLSCASYAEDPAAARPAFTEQYVMLYYRDISAASDFYGTVLGLNAVMDDEWVKLYEVIPGSLIGVVKEGGTAYHRAQKNNAVMVSIVTEDVDAWYQIVKSRPDINMLKGIYNHDSVPIRAFLVADPGGYTIEIFEWLK